MSKLSLVAPTLEYKDDVMSYREEMLKNNDSLDGCAGLEECQSYEEWLNFEARYKAKGFVPSQVYLAVKPEDNKVVGMIDYRYPLNEALLRYGGNIGYSVRPSERNKGYATQMLSLLLPICCESGDKRVLLTCHDNNSASEKVIRKNGGVLENTTNNAPGSSTCVGIKRFWIEL